MEPGLRHARNVVEHLRAHVALPDSNWQQTTGRNRAIPSRLLSVERLSYVQVAAAIADANDDSARAAAAALVAAYHAIDPPLETTRERMALLKQALISALEREGK